MKYIQYILFFFVFTAGGTGVSGCKEEKPQTKDLYLTHVDSILQIVNADRPDWDRVTITEGSVNLIVRENKLIVVHEADLWNETMYYFLQIENNDHKLSNAYMVRAEVIFFGRGLVVNSLMEKRTLYFHLESDKIPSYVKEMGKVKSYAGYGLGVRKITHGSPGEKAPYCACDHSYTPPGNCKAGGVLEVNCGTSNDYGSCRVTCTGQTYACCDRGFE